MLSPKTSHPEARKRKTQIRASLSVNILKLHTTIARLVSHEACMHRIFHAMLHADATRRCYMQNVYIHAMLDAASSHAAQTAMRGPPRRQRAPWLSELHGFFSASLCTDVSSL